jgi:hypothetical protein
MEGSLYRPGVVFPDLESCFPRNKGLRDKIGLGLYFPKNIRDRQSECMPLAVRLPAHGCAMSVKNRSSTTLLPDLTKHLVVYNLANV